LDDSVAQRYHDAQALLSQWDLSTDLENRVAALGTCLVSAEWLAEKRGNPVPEAWQELQRCTDVLLEAVGRIDPPWGEVNRHVRGELNLPVGGGPDTLRAIYGRGIEDDGFHTNVAGDGLYYLVSWDTQGKQTVRGVHQFGSATLDENSPHFADQASDYAAEILHDPLFDPQRRKPLIRRRYRPGE
ncbi:MAG: penicillin acylase family protein, partial [Lysobacterales bacterium]